MKQEMKYERAVVEAIIQGLKGYDLNGDTEQFDDYYFEVIESLIDINIADLFDSAYFLYSSGYLFSDIEGDIVLALRNAQLNYYIEIGNKHHQMIYKEVV